MLFGVFGVAAAPLIAHWGVSIFMGGQSLQQDIYLMALVLWGGLFYELRCNPDHTLKSARLRIYAYFMHWFSAACAAAMALGYALLVARLSNGVATPLARPELFGTLLVVAIAGYLAFKIPVMWGHAEDEALRGPSG